MELSLTTFILEVVNFLVLVWILKRLFFVPIKKAIESRRLDIKKSLDDAENSRVLAEKLRAQYENRLKDWEREKEVKFNELKKDLDLQRERRLKDIGLDAVKETERLRVQEEKTRKETKELQEREAITQSLSFLSKLLSNFSSKEVEASIIRTFSESLKSQNEPKLLLNGRGSGPADLMVHSAFPLSEQERSQLMNEFEIIFKERPLAKFDVDPTLLAGIEVTVGSKVLRANLRDELKYFSGVGGDGT